jgi:hypothetical protein
MEEAERVIEQLKGVAVTLAKPAILTGNRLGRWDTHLTQQERHDLMQSISNELEKLGVDKQQIDEALEEYHRFVVFDLLHPIDKPIRDFLLKRTQEIDKQIASLPQPISDQTEIRRLMGLRAEHARWKKRVSSVRDAPYTTAYRQLHQVLNDCPLLEAADGKDLVNSLSEELEDLKHYCETKTHRRLKLWLSNGEGVA